ncbi:hypothetical protein [Natronomonas marina]|jgi:hypothetical protein|uniref:hypothetical protein n=1 Tax=Natronomonas marina TaxID=2961939 RepID=UPI0020C9EF72|nr:hypothetical protein [Natronomonas marina]
MEDALEIVDVLADAGLEEEFAWLLRILGILAILAGLGLWLLTDMGLLVIPAALIVLGIVLLVIPQVLLALTELA